METPATQVWPSIRHRPAHAINLTDATVPATQVATGESASVFDNGDAANSPPRQEVVDHEDKQNDDMDDNKGEDNNRGEGWHEVPFGGRCPGLRRVPNGSVSRLGRLAVWCGLHVWGLQWWYYEGQPDTGLEDSAVLSQWLLAKGSSCK